ncbi:MAG: hypothetical protein NTY19_06240 [Planctomycetota bacterium]|nr:hypothetical protein [Planctomycetota bacterium]
MLICYGGRFRFPQSVLAYAAFRLAACDTLAAIESHADLGEDAETSLGYLAEVPFLEQCPLLVQLDLLADVWNRHRRRQPFHASLLDAAVVYAACHTAARLSEYDPKWAAAGLKSGPRKANPRIVRGAAARLTAVFDDFWDDYDFLLLEDMQDLAPDLADAIKLQLGLTEDCVEPLYEALGRAYPSSELAANLDGLLSTDEIRAARKWLQNFRA